MIDKWSMTIEIHSYSFEGLKYVCKGAFSRIASCESLKAFPMIISSGDPYGSWYRVDLACPVTERISQLRREANELEKSLWAR